MHTFFRDIIVGGVIIAVTLLVAVVLPCFDIIKVGDIGNYVAGVGNILLAIVAFFSFCVAYRTFISDQKARYESRNEKRYSDYKETIERILTDYHRHKDLLCYVRQYYDQYGQLLPEESRGSEVLDVLYDEFEIIRDTFYTDDYVELTQRSAMDLSEEIMCFYENMIDCNLKEQQQHALDMMLEEARKRIVCMDYHLTHDVWKKYRNAPDDEKEKHAAELFCQKNRKSLFSIVVSFEAIGRQLYAAERYEPKIRVPRGTLRSSVLSSFYNDDINLLKILSLTNNHIYKLIH